MDRSMHRYVHRYGYDVCVDVLETKTDRSINAYGMDMARIICTSRLNHTITISHTYV